MRRELFAGGGVPARNMSATSRRPGIHPPFRYGISVSKTALRPDPEGPAKTNNGVVSEPHCPAAKSFLSEGVPGGSVGGQSRPACRVSRCGRGNSSYFISPLLKLSERAVKGGIDNLGIDDAGLGLIELEVHGGVFEDSRE